MDKILSLFIIVSIALVIFISLMIYYRYNSNRKRQYYIRDTPSNPKYIPKKIFQIIADKHKINSSFQKNIEYIKKLNPDWQYRILDDKDITQYILDNYSPEILAIYNKINPKYGAARADFFRYLLMYKEGGVYLDIKSAMEFPLEYIINDDDEYILAHWGCNCQSSKLQNTLGEYQQWHIICRPDHPFLKTVIDTVIENIKTYRISDGVGKNGVLKLTGPIAYTEAIMPLVDKYPCRIIEVDDYIGLIYNNIGTSHINLFGNKHYSKIQEPIILNN